MKFLGKLRGAPARMLAAICGVGMALGTPLAVSAQEDVDLSPEQESAVQWAQERGELLYRYDQAAWHGTDAFLEDFQAERDGPSMRGYIVVKGDEGRLDTVFFGDFGDGMVEAARYSVDGSEVVSGTYFDEGSRPPLSAEASRMAAMRQVAFEALGREEVGLCADASPNTVVLPPEADGSIEVYVLTPPVSNDAYPLGGHYRVKIDADGEVTDWRRFLNSCFMLRAANQTDEDGNPMEPTMLVVSHLLDPHPTEIHFFATHYFQLPVAVATVDNDIIWTVAGGQFHGAFSAPN